MSAQAAGDAGERWHAYAMSVICACKNGTHADKFWVGCIDTEADRARIIADHDARAQAEALWEALAYVRTGTFRLPGETRDRVSHSLGGMPQPTRAHWVDEDCALCAALAATAQTEGASE